MGRELFDLAERITIVAGGAGYLGSAICHELTRRGARVIVADIDVTKAERLAEELNGMRLGLESHAFSLDMRREDSIHCLVDRVRSAYQRVDILVNATYAPQEKPLEEITESDFTQSLGCNVSGSFLLAREAKRAMSNGGNIVIFSSMYGRVSPEPRIYHDPMVPNAIEYGVAKAGIEQMIRYLAVAWAPDGIRVNGIALGPFPNLQVQESYPDFIERLAQRVPLGRTGRPDEIVGAVVFLTSDAASYVTGHTLVVDGGWTIW